MSDDETTRSIESWKEIALGIANSLVHAERNIRILLDGAEAVDTRGMLPVSQDFWRWRADGLREAYHLSFGKNGAYDIGYVRDLIKALTPPRKERPDE